MIKAANLKLAFGDLVQAGIDGEFDVIVHGCNCFNTMGSGIAGVVRQRLPAAWEVDQQTVSGDKLKVGTYTSAQVGDLTVINAYTQYRYGAKPGEDFFEYEGFVNILVNLAKEHGTKRIGFPAIGCGLAGGDAVAIINMLEDFAGHVAAQGGSVTLVIFP